MAGVAKVAEVPRWSSRGSGPAPPFEEYRAIARAAGQAIAEKYILQWSRSYVSLSHRAAEVVALEGKATLLSADFNTINLGDVSAGELVLSVHWVDGWATRSAHDHRAARAPRRSRSVCGIRSSGLSATFTIQFLSLIARRARLSSSESLSLGSRRSSLYIIWL